MPFLPILPVPTMPIVVPIVPFYSQVTDIDLHDWQKKGCGIASLAMLVNYYKPDTVSVNKLLALGIAAGAYDKNAGWIHKGLISLANQYDLTGKTYDLSKSTNTVAFAQFKKILKDGPVMVSIHYKFDPKSTIPHLVVIDGIDEDGMIHYNDPASGVGDKEISEAKFLAAWKKRFIVIRPIVEVAMVDSSFFRI